MPNTCPHCRADLEPVAICDGVWGCATCRQTWFIPTIPAQPTPDSIASAKATRDHERAELARLTGVTITEDGTVILPQPVDKSWYPRHPRPVS